MMYARRFFARFSGETSVRVRLDYFFCQMNFLSFYTTKELTKRDLITFCGSALSVSEVQWEDDSIEKIPGSNGPITAFIQLFSSSGQFSYHYEIYLSNLPAPLTKRDEVDWLCGLARDYQLEALTVNEEINPFSFIHIVSEGVAIEVDIKSYAEGEKEELTIDGFYNFPLGSFATETGLSELEQRAPDELVDPVLDHYEYVTYGVEEMNNDFTHQRKDFASLMNYDHFYRAKITGQMVCDMLWQVSPPA